APYPNPAALRRDVARGAGAHPAGLAVGDDGHRRARGPPGPPYPAPDPPRGGDTPARGAAALAADGAALYLNSCSACHGPNGEGTTGGPPLKDAGAAAADFYLRTGRMPLGSPEQRPVHQAPAFN